MIDLTTVEYKENDIRRQLNRWCEIDLGSLERNFEAVRAFVPKDKKILAVVKADGYGYGMAECAKIFSACGADMLGVTTVTEGITLRKAGIDTATLVFVPMLPSEAELFVANNLTPTVTAIDAVEALAQAAGGAEVRYQIKLNTGMNRFGIDEIEAADLLDAANKYPNLVLEGIYSHLATVSTDIKMAKAQVADFIMMCDELQPKAKTPFLRHIAASNGLLKLPEAQLDMVRAGSVLYGQMPSAANYGVLTEDPWSLYGRIVATQNVRRNAGIGYGFDEKALNDMRVGIVPLGYCDGIGQEAMTRIQNFKGRLRVAAQAILGHLNNYAYLADGTRIRFAGRIAMQSCILDITSYEDLKVGDKLRFVCRRTLLSSDIPRVYVRDAEVCGLSESAAAE